MVNHSSGYPWPSCRKVLGKSIGLRAPHICVDRHKRSEEVQFFDMLALRSFRLLIPRMIMIRQNSWVVI